MKRLFTILLSFAMLLLLLPTNLNAAPLSFQTDFDYCGTEIVYQDEEITIKSALYIQNNSSGMQTFAMKTKSAQKTVSIENSNGAKIATYTLYGTFQYDGNSATCTSAVCSTSVQDSSWSFTSATAAPSGNKAVGSYTIKNSSTGSTKSGSATLTCSKSGVIS